MYTVVYYCILFLLYLIVYMVCIKRKKRFWYDEDLQKKQFVEKFIIDNRKYRKKKLVIETNSRKCERPEANAAGAITTSIKLCRGYKIRMNRKAIKFSELYFNLVETKQTNSSKIETAHLHSVPTPQIVTIHLAHWFGLTRMLESLPGCRTMFLFAVFCKIGALDLNDYWFHV